ncbi:MAG: type II toxin-antitoxin system RelE/ParE family toxin [Candidatus Accumulibacter sp.]|nr:type II toxin-antitoxin system RelE/ParE family toxin [Accumulibacter sp.]
MSGFVLTNAALTDLESIGRYTADAWGREQRNRYLGLLDTSFHQLAANPLKGRDCPEIRPGIRKYAIERHVVFYRTIDDGSNEVLRVLHVRMDMESHLSEPGSD